jgi:putative NIF3 family GTP cyclohydrolase 1 type 2
MRRVDWSRREFVQTTAAALLPVGGLQGTAKQTELTVQQLVDRVVAKLGVSWREKSMDGFKAGSPATVITGVATTAMATLPVLRRAVAAGHNLIVTQEPTFYATTDEPGNRAQDAVYLAKKAFIDEHRLVIWRFNDHWNARQPSEAASALAETLLWKGNRVAGAEEIYTVPETTFAALVAHIRSRLPMRGGLRTVGRSDMRVRTVWLSPGTTDMAGAVAQLPRADVIVAGEPREWEVVPYVLDARTAGQEKGMIALGRVVSEEPGMRACAAWIKTLAPEVRIEAFAIGDSYWSPAS